MDYKLELKVSINFFLESLENFRLSGPNNEDI